ncbi:MAG: hypothetical protein J6M59_11800 [Bacteroidaceae bacterium]|nr:hypothetical protein [Bacteroidaceae bacterium]
MQKKLPKHGLTFCRIFVLELCSLATEGTQEFPPLNDFVALRQCELQTRAY